MLKEEIKEFAKKCGADLVGIGSMDRYDGAPMQSDPRYIFPEAKSIIGLGFRIHRGLLRGIEEGTYFAGYPALGYASINDVYAPMVLREVGNLLEDNGYEAILYQNTSVRLGTGVGKPVAPDKPKPDVFLHFRISAFICGMGEIGYSKVFLTPEFGPRQRFAFIITDAPIDPDPLFEGEICDKCMSCVKECTAEAIKGDKTVKVTVAGKELEWNDLDADKCSAIYQAGTPEYSPFMNDETKAVIQSLLGREFDEQKLPADYNGDIWRYLREKMPYIRNTWESYHHPACIEGARGCVRACMIHLEETGRIKNLFKNPFRIRKPWQL
jgi:epoxyqueuosine reductase